MNEELKKKIIQKLNQPGFEDHKFPTTRRELVKLGLAAGAMAVMPLSFAERVLAATNSTNRATIPFLVFDLKGGASMPGNFLVGKAGGPEDIPTNYKAHGWNPRAAESLNKSFGLPMSEKFSKMLQGLKETLPQELLTPEQSKLKMGSYCNFSLSDVATNKISALTLASKAGLIGRFSKKSLGLWPNFSGGNSDVYLGDPRFQPKVVGNIQDLLSLTSFGEKFESLPETTRREIFVKLQALAGNISLLRETYSDLGNSGITRPEMDPRNSKEIASAYRLNQGEDPTAITLQSAVVYNVVKGYTGPGVITFDGCDYHDNSQTTGDAKDLEVGRAIGRAISTASLLNKPLFFQIITDGGIYANQSDNYERIWRGDENQHSLTVIGYFNPKGGIQQRRLQVGSYLDSGRVDIATAVGQPDSNRMILGVMANYLNLHGQLGRFEEVLDSRIGANEIDDTLIFG